MVVWDVDSYSGFDLSEDESDTIYMMSPEELLERAKDLEGRPKKKRVASDAYLHLARRYIVLRKGDAALKILKHATDLNSSNGQAWFHLGMLYREEHQYHGASHCFKKSLRFRPKVVEHWVEQGVVKYILGEWNETIRFLRKSLEIERTSRGLQYLGLALFEVGEREEALIHLQEAHALAPEDQQIMFSLGILLFREGEVAEARELLQSSVEHPKHQRKKVQLRIRDALDIGNEKVETWMCLGDIFERIEREWETTIIYGIATRVDPKHAQAWFQLAQVQHNYELYEGCILQAWMCDPRDPDILYAHAETFYEAGLTKDALDMFNEVLAMRPDHSGALFRQGEIHDEFEEAEKQGHAPYLGEYGCYVPDEAYDDY